MRPDVKLEITVGTLRAMTPEQLVAINDLLADGKWEHHTESLPINGSGEYLGVHFPGLFIGIEKDGYTHS